MSEVEFYNKILKKKKFTFEGKIVRLKVRY